MGKKLLVAYTSWAGSTKEVANVIADEMLHAGFDVTIRPVKEIESVDEFESIIVGTPVRIGRLKSDTIKFIQRFKDKLQNKFVAYFVVCLTMEKDTPENRATVEKYLEPLRNVKSPVSQGLFSGVMDPNRLEQPFRFLFTLAKMQPQDFRRWEEIRGWAKETSLKFGV